MDGIWASCTYVGLTADGRIIIDKARVECQSHRLTVEDPVSVEFITRYIAAHKQVRLPLLLSLRAAFEDEAADGDRLFGVSQRYTQSGGVRPFGISCLLIGFDPNDSTPRLYLTEPSGIYSAWKVRLHSPFCQVLLLSHLIEGRLLDPFYRVPDA
jgi:20S proteasome subunit alpha 4